MSWHLFRWTWRLDAPLFVGASPSGSLNRCRLYVPARTLWGAITAELARAEAEDSFPRYENIGNELSDGCRFTYLFPSECYRGSWMAWLPECRAVLGLGWRAESGGDPVGDRTFRRSLLWTRAGAAIAPDRDAADAGSLRETECVQPYRRIGDNGLSVPVGMTGHVFIRDRKLLERLSIVDQVFLGGDARYGLGLVSRVEMEPAEDVFGLPVDLRQDHPFLLAQRILGHAEDCDDMEGIRELVAGWDLRGDQWEPYRNRGALWSPGSIMKHEAQWWKIEGCGGIWRIVGAT